MNYIKPHSGLGASVSLRIWSPKVGAHFIHLVILEVSLDDSGSGVLLQYVTPQRPNTLLFSDKTDSTQKTDNAGCVSKISSSTVKHQTEINISSTRHTFTQCSLHQVKVSLKLEILCVHYVSDSKLKLKKVQFSPSI